MTQNGTVPPARIQFPHHYRTIDPAIRRELVDHAAADGFPISGILYLPPGGEPDTVVVAMHPRVDFSRHYLAPRLAAGGYAFFGAHTRYLNNDADMDRALLGKGILPLREIFHALEDGGYRGWYEIEIISDDVDAMGYERVLRQTRTAFARLMPRR